MPAALFRPIAIEAARGSVVIAHSSSAARPANWQRPPNAGPNRSVTPSNFPNPQSPIPNPQSLSEDLKIGGNLEVEDADHGA
jgi:hypothetical protein